MLNMKYVLSGIEVIIFSSNISHDHAAKLLSGPAKSAGHIKIKDNNIHCYGHSHSLGLKPHDDDSAIIKMQIER